MSFLIQPYTVRPPSVLDAPVSSLDTTALISELAKRLTEAEKKLELKADENSFARILLTDRDILLQGDRVSIAGQLNIVDWIRDISGNPTGEIDITSLTRISGGKIQTGVISSTNWSTTTGSSFDLNQGVLALGGSAAPKFQVDALGKMTCIDAEVTGVLKAGSIITGSVMIDDKMSMDALIASGYNADMLSADLATGVGSVLAGIGGNYRLQVVDSMVLLHHKDAVYNAAAAAGSVKHALALTATGIAMGYNRASDGQWVNSVAIDANGNASFSGTINATSGYFTGTIQAGSIITSSVTVDGTTLSTISSNASLGVSAYYSVGSKLEASSSYTLAGVVTPANSGGIRTGSITWNSTTGVLTGGTGIAITENGIVGASSGVAKFVLDTAGNATFAGDLVTAGNVTCTGVASSQSHSVLITGTNYTIRPTILAEGATSYSGQARVGVVGVTSSSSSSYSIGVVGTASGGSLAAIGVLGHVKDGYSGIGVMGVVNQGSSFGVIAQNYGGGFALRCDHAMQMYSSNLVTNLNADYLDGSHASAFALTSHAHTTLNQVSGATHTYGFTGGITSGSATATFVGTNKPGGSTTNAWISIVIDGSTFYIPAWT